MSKDLRVLSLKAKHAELETQVYQEQRRVRPNEAVVRTLKRQKLNIKDQLQRLIASAHRSHRQAFTDSSRGI
jgi:hypothetical protein